MGHERLDAIAWQTIRNRAVPRHPPRGVENGGRAGDFQEVELLVREGCAFDDAFESWLQEMYLYRSESFFAVPPSTFFSPEHRAWMAGAVEGLSKKLDIPTPQWVGSPDFFLSEIWDWEQEALDIFFPAEWADMLDSRLAQSDPEFRRRRIIGKLRFLIRV